MAQPAATKMMSCKNSRNPHVCIGRSQKIASITVTPARVRRCQRALYPPRHVQNDETHDALAIDCLRHQDHFYREQRAILVLALKIAGDEPRHWIGCETGTMDVSVNVLQRIRDKDFNRLTFKFAREDIAEHRLKRSRSPCDDA